jgi:hypothetical protein
MADTRRIIEWTVTASLAAVGWHSGDRMHNGWNLGFFRAFGAEVDPLHESGEWARYGFTCLDRPASMGRGVPCTDLASVRGILGQVKGTQGGKPCTLTLCVGRAADAAETAARNGAALYVFLASGVVPADPFEACERDARGRPVAGPVKPATAVRIRVYDVAPAIRAGVLTLRKGREAHGDAAWRAVRSDGYQALKVNLARIPARTGWLTVEGLHAWAAEQPITWKRANASKNASDILARMGDLLLFKSGEVRKAGRMAIMLQTAQVPLVAALMNKQGGVVNFGKRNVRMQFSNIRTRLALLDKPPFSIESKRKTKEDKGGYYIKLSQ